MHSKLLKIQSELKAPKNQLNAFGKYNYRSCEDIIEAVKPLLHAEELILTISDEVVAVGDRNYVKATASILDGENELHTTAYAREEAVKKGMDGAQITGSASSYARKYALNGLFAIDDTKDADATNTHDKEKPEVTLSEALQIVSKSTTEEELTKSYKTLPKHLRDDEEIIAKCKEVKEIINQ